MLGLKSTMSIIDNSGALIAECIKVARFKTGTGGKARVGDEITVVIKKARPIALSATGAAANKMRKGTVAKAVVVRTKFATVRPDGRLIRFDDNAAVLINDKKEMIGNRISSVVSAELRQRWGKIVSLAPKVV